MTTLRVKTLGSGGSLEWIEGVREVPSALTNHSLSSLMLTVLKVP